jgi:DNA-binding response OmpR family regulator
MSQKTDEAGTFFYVLQDALRILFVDDDPILREFAQVYLTTDSAAVTTAEDGLAALEALQAPGAAAPDVVLLDLEMPRMDGFEVLAHLRADGAYERTPVIVVTGREDVAAIDRAFLAGATSFVVKPLNWRLLSYQIRYVHRTHQAELSLLEARRRARAETHEANRALGELCVSGSRFLATALGAAPGLRSGAGDYLAALETASRASRRLRAS